MEKIINSMLAEVQLKTEFNYRFRATQSDNIWRHETNINLKSYLYLLKNFVFFKEEYHCLVSQSSEEAETEE